MATELVEVRAIVRLEMLDRVIRSLRECGVPRFTVTRVHAIGAGVDPAAARLSVQQSAEYADKALIQFVCERSCCGEITTLIAATARTGRQGDGIVYLVPVEAVTKIRSGTTGAAALR